MIPEDIKKQIDDAVEKYAFVVPYDGSNNFYDKNKIKPFQDGAEFGYTLFSKESWELREKYLRSVDEWAGYERDFLKQLSDAKAEIEKKDKELNEQSKQLVDDINEFERLRNLIEKAYSIGWNVGVDREPYDKKLKQFKTENSL